MFFEEKELALNKKIMSRHFKFFLLLSNVVVFLFISCNNNNTSNKVKNVSQLNASVAEIIKKNNPSLLKDSGKYENDVSLVFYKVVNQYYQKNNEEPTWSDNGKFNDLGKNLLSYLDTSIRDGLLKEQYHYKDLENIDSVFAKDSTQKLNAAIWAKADFLLTDAYFHILSDLKQGRLVSDSASWKNDASKYDAYFIQSLQNLKTGKQFSKIIDSVQPRFQNYMELKKGIQSFFDSMSKQTFTFVEYPYVKSIKSDSLTFFRQLHKRLGEEGYLNYDKNNLLDSVALSKVLIKYQSKKGLEVDGKVGGNLVNCLNLTDEVRLKRILITLDRYKLLTDPLPARYLMVNLPAYKFQLWDKGKLALTSKIICGKPGTPTPLLSAEINEMVIFPTWTVPSSIVSNEMLPGLRRSSGYLSRRGLSLYNDDGKRIDPSSVNWGKYRSGIPYRIVQSSGNSNALGVMKFNFDNPFSVYLHDTNQRGLFNNSYRALSHGCVRVENWRGLANYIATSDSATFSRNDTLRYNIDSISNWLEDKANRRIRVKNKLQLYIKYFTCEGENGKIIFHDDIYGEDRKLLQQFFLTNN
jgi:murein L,D-transpeptidase YcbB/YkuD